MQKDDSKNEQEMKSKGQPSEEAAVSASAQNGSETKEAEVGAASRDIVMFEAEEEKVQVVQLMTFEALSILYACASSFADTNTNLIVLWHLVSTLTFNSVDIAVTTLLGMTAVA